VTARPLLLTTLPWLLVSHVAWQQCTPGACVPSTDLPRTSTRALGQYATQRYCETVRQVLADAWGKLKAEADKDVPPPTDQALRMVTTFVCEPAPETPEAR
jgi:hypothetical protein